MEPSPLRLCCQLPAWLMQRIAGCAVVVCQLGLATGATAADATLSYNEHIRPILVENCFSCHGADSASRQADLRLDRRDDAVALGAIVPGDPDSTAILDRVYSDDPEVVMPPPETKKTLSAEQKEMLVRWVKEGAEYEPHWSFIPPARPPLPEVRQADWVRNPVDRFVLARLEAEGLTPAAEANRRTLARRWDERPVRFIFGPFLDPADEHFFLLCRKCLLRFRRRHHHLGVIGIDPVENGG